MFGEKHGYSTIEQFLSYMDKYATLPAVGTFDGSLGNQTQEIRAPLYVFDNGVLEKHFQKDYHLPGVLRGIRNGASCLSGPFQFAFSRFSVPILGEYSDLYIMLLAHIPKQEVM